MVCRTTAFLLAVAIAQCGCGGGTFIAFTNTGSADATVSGIVTIVQITTVANGGNFADITVVTFTTGNNARTVRFCGNIADQFFLDQLMRADFRPGPVCASAVFVVRL